MITVLVLLLVAVVLFAAERIPVDFVVLILVGGLVITGTLTPGEAFSGFGNEVVIAIAGLFVLTGALRNTGVVDEIGRRMHRIAGTSERWLTLLVMVLAAACASVMKNTSTTAMLLPLVIGLADRAKIPRSKLLMPLAFGAILGGTCTLIGTSTNMAVSAAMVRHGMAPLGMFELASVGIPIVVVGIAYMFLLGRRMLPDRGTPEGVLDTYRMREFLSEVVVLPGSSLAGRTLAQADIAGTLDLTVVGIIRGKSESMTPAADTVIEPNDLLLVQGKVDDILRVKDKVGIEIKADFKLSDADLGKELFEVLVQRQSEFLGRTLKGLRFRQRYGLTVLGLYRQGVAQVSKLSTMPLRFGDLLLLQGSRRNVGHLSRDGHLLVLDEVSERRGRPGKKRWAIFAFLTFVALTLPHAWNVPISIAVLIGALILVASKAIRANEIYGLIEWRVVVLIAGMISFGVAMEKTGADEFLAHMIVRATGQHGPHVVIAGFFLLTVALTQPMSNQAAALVVLPVAIKTASSLGLEPRAFAIAVTCAASCSFLTPLEPACVLVYAPGRYRFMDFVKVGSALTIAVFAIVMALLPVFWPLK